LIFVYGKSASDTYFQSINSKRQKLSSCLKTCCCSTSFSNEINSSHYIFICGQKNFHRLKVSSCLTRAHHEKVSSTSPFTVIGFKKFHRLQLSWSLGPRSFIDFTFSKSSGYAKVIDSRESFFLFFFRKQNSATFTI